MSMLAQILTGTRYAAGDIFNSNRARNKVTWTTLRKHNASRDKKLVLCMTGGGKVH